MRTRADGLLHMAEVARILGYTRQTIHNYVELGYIKPSKRQVSLSGYTRYLFDPQDIENIKNIIEESIDVEE